MRRDILLGCALAVAGCSSEYPNDQVVWGVRTTPNATQENVMVGHLTLTDDGNGNPVATLSEFVSSGAHEIDLDWAGVWEFDGDVLTVDLACETLTTQNAPDMNCDELEISLTCSVEEDLVSPSQSILDCGSYVFE